MTDGLALHLKPVGKNETKLPQTQRFIVFLLAKARSMYLGGLDRESGPFSIGLSNVRQPHAFSVGTNKNLELHVLPPT